MGTELSKAELVKLIEKIMNFQGTERELIELMKKFNDNVSHPWGANLAFSPGRGEKRAPDYKPLPEEIVEKALAYERLPRSLLTQSEKRVILECMKAAVKGPFFPDWEFTILFGMERAAVVQIVENWEEVDIFVDNEVALAVNNAMNNLTGYPHKQDDVWDEWISIPKDQVRLLLDKWYHTVEWKRKPIIIINKRGETARSRGWKRLS